MTEPFYRVTLVFSDGDIMHITNWGSWIFTLEVLDFPQVDGFARIVQIYCELPRVKCL